MTEETIFNLDAELAEQQHRAREADARIERLKARAAAELSLLERARPCPFCGCHALMVTDWWDDDGEYPAIGCQSCKAEAPATVWNTREAT